MFKAGDLVRYTGAIDHYGRRAKYHQVDERIAGKSLTASTAAEAASLPLTALTAYAMLFDSLRVNAPVPSAAVIIGGSGGV
jgi:NADPH2:quinone reductase